MREDVVEGPRVQARIAREDAGGGQDLVGRGLAGRTGQRSLAAAAGAAVVPAVVTESAPPGAIGRYTSAYQVTFSIGDIIVPATVDVALHAGAVTSVSVPSAPTAAADSVVNLNSKNPGAFVPSTFTSYGEAVELGKLEASLKPTTLAEAARLAQEQKKTASRKSVIVVERNDDGKLVIAPATKQ